ncbi:hypothetical protein GOP47_0015836 [Adiantum capillus-veneris]|uniref:Pectinesterase n=1 Tax=Adiantum capillus-veneris TaxID=13818 RepID=A0A9D4ZDK8_ADICA|nr:hypothetical protein GOP47_0015836 [Adiantum capillus-veneris]
MHIFLKRIFSHLLLALVFILASIFVVQKVNSTPFLHSQIVLIRRSLTHLQLSFDDSSREKVFIPYTKPFITLQGFNSSTTIIAWNDTAGKKGVDNNPLGTYKSATIAIDAPYFIAKNITFKNTSPRPTPGSNNSQAVALRISGDAAVFMGCQFLGAQDTLYDHKGRHFFQDCYVEGSVDFIFGNGLSMYRNCHLHAIGAPYQAITAQNRANPLDDSGFSFINCKVTGSGPLYLGRAWGTFSRVIYSFTYMDELVLPKGWNDWNDPKRQL